MKSNVALTMETEMEIKHLPMDEIYSDNKFNIRGDVDGSGVVTLAHNINTHGLLQPITVQPYDKASPFKYRIIVGHRRYAAFQHLNRNNIPVIIKHGLSEVDALALNFIENIERQNLNILQEAMGINRFIELGETIDTIIKLTKKGRNWVTIRYALLGMPKAIQEDAAAGYLTQVQIKELSEIKDVDEQYQIVKAIKDARFRGETRLPTIIKKKTKPTTRKRRSPEEAFAMIDHIIVEMGKGNLATRALAWVMGEISDLDFYRDLQDYAKENHIRYNPPSEIKALLIAESE